jgi:MFS family permease
MKSKFGGLYLLHVLNDGFQASLLLLLPFIAKDLQISLSAVGILGGALNVLQVVLALPAGVLAHKYGGYKMLLLSLFLYSLGFIGVGISPVYYLLLMAFIVSGLGFGIFHPIAFAEVANSSDKTTRGTIMGNFTAIGDIGKIGLSTIVTFIVSYIGWRSSSFVFAGVGLVLFAILFRIFNKNNDHVEVKQKEHFKGEELKELFKNKKFVLATASSFLDSFASSSLFVFLPFLLLYRNIDPKVLGAFTSAFFVGNFFGKILLGRLTDKFGYIKVFIISEILMAVFILILANSSYLIIIVGASIILGCFTKGTVPVLNTIISESVEGKNSFEKAFGLNHVITNVAMVLAPIVLGFTSDKFGIVPAFAILAVFALSATIPAYFYSKESAIDVMKAN